MFKKETISAKNPLHTKGCKGLAVLTIIVLLFSCFCFPTSALINEGAKWYNGVRIYSVYLWVRDENNNIIDTSFKITNGSFSDGLEISLASVDGNFLPDKKYTVMLDMEIDTKLDTFENYLIASYQVTTNEYNEKIIALNQLARFGENQDGASDTQNAQYSPVRKFNSSGGVYHSGYNVKYNGGILGFNYDVYVNSFLVQPSRERENMTFRFENIDFRVVSPEEYSVQQGLEQEKQETESSGNKGMDELASAVPDYSGNVLQTFGALVNSMSHTNTDCVITMPEIKVPKIGKYFNEIVLLEEREIDISSYINYIPYMLVEIVRALFSSALILFCVKELYGILEYIFVLRGGNR